MSLPAGRSKKLLVLLLLLAALAWVVLLRAPMDAMTSAPLFLGLWVVMMVAMMLPSAAPMVLTFSRIYEKKRQQGFVPTWTFVSGYLVLWSLFGALAYLAALSIAVLNVPWLDGRFAGALLIISGLYQFTALKNACLQKCQSPFDFLFSSWHDGRLGAFRMGLKHGAYCLGCCWLLFLILFPLGVMNIALMALLTVLIFAEKSWSRHIVTRAAGIVLIAFGAASLLMPGLLPTA